MSFYRFARATALIALLKRYKASLLRILIATSFAIVSSMLYPDIANFVEARHPQALGWVLAIKTLIVYCALFLALWELHRAIQGDITNEPAKLTAATTPNPATNNTGSQANPARPLDTLIDKPKLKSRKDALLDE